MKISSAIESGGPLPDDLKAHLECCRSCRRFHARQAAVARLLHDSPPDQPDYPETLNASIMRAIRDPAPDDLERNRESSRISPWLAPLSFASLALIAALYLILRQTPSDAPLVAEQESPVEERTVVAETAPSDYIRTWSVALDRPLDREIDNVVADARSAARFLAINFLPESKETGNL